MSRVELGRFVNLMTQIQSDPLFKKNLQPNPTHQLLKTNPTWQAGLNQVGFGELGGTPLVETLTRNFKQRMWLARGCNE